MAVENMEQAVTLAGAMVGGGIALAGGAMDGDHLAQIVIIADAQEAFLATEFHVLWIMPQNNVRPDAAALADRRAALNRYIGFQYRVGPDVCTVFNDAVRPDPYAFF